MNLNAYIIQDHISLPAAFSVIHSNPLECNLNKISFYQEKTMISHNHIYLISEQQLMPLIKKKIPGVFAVSCENFEMKIPDCMDILFWNKDINYFQIYEALQDLFQLFSNWEKELYRLSDENAPLNRFGESALPFLRNPICMYTSSLRLVFFSERKKPSRLCLFTEDAIDAYLPDEEIDLLKMDEEFIATVSRTEPGIFSADMWGYRILYHNIRVDNIYVARLMLCETDFPLQSGDSALLIFLADFVTHIMEKKNMTLNSHPKYFDTCICSLLDRQEPEKSQLTTVLDSYHWDLEDTYFCAVISICNYDEAIHTVSAVCSRLENKLPGSAALVHNDTIVLLVNLTLGKISKEEHLSSLVYILRDGLLKAGVSLVFHHFIHVADFYDQAQAALTLGNSRHETIWCYHYENYALTHLLTRTASSSSTESLCPTALLELLEYDRLHHRNFTYSLKIFLEHNMNIAQTIRILYLQRATFLYQWKRIQEITGLDLENDKIRLHLRIIFEILEERGLNLKNPNYDILFGS